MHIGRIHCVAYETVLFNKTERPWRRYLQYNILRVVQ